MPRLQMLPLLIVVAIPSVAAYTQIDDAPKVTTKSVAGAPDAESAQLQVRMVGFEVNKVHITGHLAKLANPAGRVSLAMPPGGCGSRELVTVTSQTHRPRCKLAVNAGYFNVHNGACIGNVVSHGTIIQTVPLSEGNVNFGIKNGKFQIGYIAPEEMPGYDMMVSGVVWLVRNGMNNVQKGWDEANITVQTSGSKYATNLASRTAMGWDKDGRLIVLQIDGSIAVGNNKRGMDMSMLADALIKHGAVEAINLDGGGSSAMAHVSKAKDCACLLVSTLMTFALVGCGNGGSPTPSPTPSPSVSPLRRCVSVPPAPPRPVWQPLLLPSFLPRLAQLQGASPRPVWQIGRAHV